MKKSLTPAQLGIIAGVLAVAAVIGGAWYMHAVLAHVPPQKKTPTSYPVAVISTELKPGGIFDKTRGLIPVASSEGEAVKYQPGDLGKEDLGQYR